MTALPADRLYPPLFRQFVRKKKKPAVDREAEDRPPASVRRG
jgi:hypothetical protein